MRNRPNWILLGSAGALLVIAMLRTFPPAKNVSAAGRQAEIGRPSTESASKFRTHHDRPISSSANRQVDMPRKFSHTSQLSVSNGSSNVYPDEAKDALTFVYDPEQSFKDAEKEFGVPATLLKAIAQAESRGEHNNGYANERGGRGLMGLMDTSEQPMLERAAQLLGIERRSLILDPVQNIRAAAALMRFYKSGTGSNSWTKALARYSGRSSDEAALYVSNIRNILTEGAVPADSTTSDLTIPPGQQNLLDTAETN
jgi:soluble lytic murein transglycosylase-like protein